jgi:putative membrane protein
MRFIASVTFSSQSEVGMNYAWKKRRPSIWKGIVAGLAGGLAGAWTMNQFQKGYSKASEALSARINGGNSRKHASDGPDATMVTADRLARSFLGHRLSRDEKQKAAPIVHYAFASAVGSAYGATAEYAPQVKKWTGAPFGAALFVGADEVALPALKLSRGPREYPLSAHLYGLTSHLVYGLTIELVRRGVRCALGA